MSATPDLGDYDALLLLASGGMASVELARHRAAGGVERLVVIKRIHPHLAGFREHLEMFLDEARLASQIRHPHVVAVDDVVDAAGELFLVQPYVESVALSALLASAAERGERLAPGLVARILSDALAGLDGAHHTRDLRGEPLGIVHRDVSPQNILVGTDGRSRVIDFGIATALRRLTVTRGGAIKGKLHYMAPEQLRRHGIDARADVFAAGVVLYEALTGVRPFDGDDEADTLLSILIGEPPPPSTHAPGLPEGLDAVVARALAVERDERWASAAELLEAIERAVPPAPPRDVASAVERLCGARLAEVQAAVRAQLDAAPASPDPRGAAPEQPSSRASAAPTVVDSRGGALAPRPPAPAASLAVDTASPASRSSAPASRERPSADAPGDADGPSSRASASPAARRGLVLPALVGLVVAGAFVLASNLARPPAGAANAPPTATADPSRPAVPLGAATTADLAAPRARPAGPPPPSTLPSPPTAASPSRSTPASARPADATSLPTSFTPSSPAKPPPANSPVSSISAPATPPPPLTTAAPATPLHPNPYLDPR